MNRCHNIFIGYTTRIFSDALEVMIESFGGFRVIWMAPVGSSLVESLQKLNDPGILILELNCPGDKDTEYIRNLSTSFPHLQILLLSYRFPKRFNGNILDTGIDGYVLKSCTRQDIYSALTRLVQGESFFCTGVAKEILDRRKADVDEDKYQLTPREKEILTLLVSGETNQVIATHLGLSENTIKTHRRNIQNKFGVTNLLGMIRYACRTRLLDFGNDTFCLSCPYCVEYRC
ncbi:MAG TPA: response regulator transcription factor [Bacteroidales bacterium]|nr:response regulator transcription factor [Bacteroidales bacterium]